LPSIWKAILRPKAEPYQFPKAEELILEEEQPSAPPLPPEEEPEAAPEVDIRIEAEEEEEVLAAAPPEPEPEPDPVSFAQIQAEEILADARREAETLMAKARADAQSEAEEVFAKARTEGRQEGYVQGMAQAGEESRQLREEQARRLEEEVHRFLEQAGSALDRQMDQSVDDLRDLALAVAEKVVCVSLKSSGDVISRMIQTAIDKRKKKEWVHIYISECDAKRLTQIPASLSAALTALSDRVRLIPMSDDESGTCIIEMPDEIVDASAATQLNNLRTILMDTANSASGMNLFH